MRLPFNLAHTNGHKEANKYAQKHQQINIKRNKQTNTHIHTLTNKDERRHRHKDNSNTNKEKDKHKERLTKAQTQ